MLTSARIIAAHIWLARSGAAFTLPAPGTVGRESKPGFDDTAWFQIGIIEDLELKLESDLKETLAPVPGSRVRHKVINAGDKFDISWTAQEVSPTTFELITASGPLTSASTQFNPLSGGGREFWVKVQAYNSLNDLIVAGDFFGYLTTDSGSLVFGREVATLKMRLMTCYSTLTTGILQ